MMERCVGQAPLGRWSRASGSESSLHPSSAGQQKAQCLPPHPTPKKPLSSCRMCCFIISSGSCCSRTAQESCGCGRNNRASGRELMGSQFRGAGSQDGGNGALGLAFTVLVPALISGVNCKLVCSPGGNPTPPVKWTNTHPAK